MGGRQTRPENGNTRETANEFVTTPVDANGYLGNERREAIES